MGITREQIKKINAKCSNDFSLDIQHAILWDEKQLEKDIFINENTKITFTLYFSKDYKNNTYIPALKVDKWIQSELSKDVWSSYGTGKKIAIESEPVKRRNISLLQKLTNNFNDELLKGYIIEFYPNILENSNQIEQIV